MALPMAKGETTLPASESLRFEDLIAYAPHGIASRVLAKTGGGNVTLLADDEPGILKTLGRALQEEGHDVVTTSSALEAQRLLSDRAFDVFVVDHHNFRVQKFDNDGVWVAMWGTKGYGPYQFESAHELACARGIRGRIHAGEYSRELASVFGAVYAPTLSVRPARPDEGRDRCPPTTSAARAAITPSR